MIKFITLLSLDPVHAPSASVHFFCGSLIPMIGRTVLAQGVHRRHREFTASGVAGFFSKVHSFSRLNLGRLLSILIHYKLFHASASSSEDQNHLLVADSSPNEPSL